MKSLVIYFSHTGENYMSDGIRNISKGNTEIVSEFISEVTGADLFKVEPVNEYPNDYHKCCDVAKDELNRNFRPSVKNKLNNINDYDVIYIGGPVWWSHYPCALFTILENLDFKGKIVKPFTTHEGSGLGDVMDDIERFCSGATVEKGLAIRGSDAANSKKVVEEWCK